MRTRAGEKRTKPGVNVPVFIEFHGLSCVLLVQVRMSIPTPLFALIYRLSISLKVVLRSCANWTILSSRQRSTTFLSQDG